MFFQCSTRGLFQTAHQGWPSPGWARRRPDQREAEEGDPGEGGRDSDICDSFDSSDSSDSSGKKCCD